HFNRLFLRFAITGGIKRVKLATILYRRQLCSENSVTETGSPASGNIKSSNSSLKGSKTARSRTPSAPRSMSSKTTSESSTTSSYSGPLSSWLSGTKPAASKSRRTPEVLESWEQNILSLHQPGLRRNHLQRWPKATIRKQKTLATARVFFFLILSRFFTDSPAIRDRATVAPPAEPRAPRRAGAGRGAARTLAAHPHH